MKWAHSIGLIAISFILSSLAACGSAAPEGPVTTSAGDTTTEAPVDTRTELEKLEGADYNGYEFGILLNNQDDRFVDVMTVGEMNGDIMNDNVYKRNLAVQEKYGIVIKTEQDEFQKVNETCKTSVMAGDSEYDLYFSNCYATGLASAGYLYELGGLPGIDLSNPWWDPAALEQLSVGGKIYLATGDISPTSLMTSSCMVFNKRLLDSVQMEYPYEAVKQGKWTLDMLAELTSDLSRDINGDSSMTLEDDLFGYTSWMCDSPYSFFYGAGGTLSVKNSEDVPEVSYDMDMITEVYDKIYRIIITNRSYFVTDAAKYPTFYECFSDGKAYFSEMTLQKIEMFLRDMKDDFGIIPIPKRNETQENYIACVNGAGGFVVVPANAENPERTGRVMEALAAGAYDGITPELYDVITKTKVARDEESAEMVDLIIEHRVFDPYYINLVKNYDFMQSALSSKKESVTSVLESGRSAAEQAMAKLAETYAENTK